MSIYEVLQEQVKNENINKIAVGGVIQIDDKFLLLKRGADEFMDGLYELPNGKMEYGETIDECIIRQIKEKTGLDIKTVNSYLGHFDYITGEGKKARQYNFSVEVNDIKKIKLSDKHSEYSLFKMTDCENCVNISEETIFILKVANMLNKIQTREM